MVALKSLGEVRLCPLERELSTDPRNEEDAHCPGRARHGCHAACSVWRDFLDAIQLGGEPRVNGEEALRVHRLIDAVLASAKSGALIRCGDPA